MNLRVVPLLGTWIEIHRVPFLSPPRLVVPLLGTWIEISIIFFCLAIVKVSFPYWERGLKSNYNQLRHA